MTSDRIFSFPEERDVVHVRFLLWDLRELIDRLFFIYLEEFNIQEPSVLGLSHPQNPKTIHERTELLFKNFQAGIVRARERNDQGSTATYKDFTRELRSLYGEGEMLIQEFREVATTIRDNTVPRGKGISMMRTRVESFIKKVRALEKRVTVRSVSQ